MAKIIVNCNNFTIEVENFETELYATAKVLNSRGLVLKQINFQYLTILQFDTIAQLIERCSKFIELVNAASNVNDVAKLIMFDGITDLKSVSNILEHFYVLK
jgi:hypothetical protein